MKYLAYFGFVIMCIGVVISENIWDIGLMIMIIGGILTLLGLPELKKYSDEKFQEWADEYEKEDR